jgi:16S rRNA (cytosine1402-N4)-methyltransferase
VTLQKTKIQDKMHPENQNKNKQHIPVLLNEVLKYLAPQPGDKYLDLTAGYGGHAKPITDITGSLIEAVLIDRDKNAVRELQKIFPANTVNFRQQDFLSSSRELIAEKRQFDLILADLGVSSPHLNEGSRGFAINKSGPLDMRMDQSQELTAETIVNTYSEVEIINILRTFGEEPKAKRIAHAIVEARPLKTTDELATVIQKAWKGKSRVHPATRTFQALRIAVNDELGLLEQSLPLWLKLLSPGGRIAVISFHSLEDRLVKKAFQEVSGERYDADFRLLTKRPVPPSQEEVVYNPRARSAKLRAAVKIKKKGNLHAYTGQK